MNILLREWNSNPLGVKASLDSFDQVEMDIPAIGRLDPGSDHQVDIVVGAIQHPIRKTRTAAIILSP